MESAAIAQSVERILGKDEVASSNLASSSNFLHVKIPEGQFLFQEPAAASMEAEVARPGGTKTTYSNSMLL